MVFRLAYTLSPPLRSIGFPRPKLLDLSRAYTLSPAVSLIGTQNSITDNLPQSRTSHRQYCDMAQQVKVAKGMRDWFGADVVLRDSIFDKVTSVFQKHGGHALDTPVAELKSTLTGKYGEDSKLIFDMADQGGEILALRYDLTLPFARWVSINNIQQVKRYHIAKVYRRDQPAIARGRMREFYQCDFDIAGAYDPMIPDAEILRIIYEVFKSLELNITIKLNHRRILDGIFRFAGVPEDSIRAISSSVDKLDKMPWDEVKKEMTDEKHLPEDVADRIGQYVQKSGGISEMLELLKADEKLMSNADIKAGVEDLDLLATYLKALDVIDTVSFDLSLARGLDYYTGLIYEVISKPDSEVSDKMKSMKLKAGADPSSQVGSIAAGGRYDTLVGMFSKKPVPCVGISFGVDRIFTILKARKENEEALRASSVDVYVMAFGDKSFEGLLLERMSVLTQLWDAGISAECTAKVKPKLPQQFKAAGDVPIAVILGDSELAEGKVRIKELGLPEGHPEKDGILIAKDTLVDEVRKRLVKS